MVQMSTVALRIQSYEAHWSDAPHQIRTYNPEGRRRDVSLLIRVRKQGFRTASGILPHEPDNDESRILVERACSLEIRWKNRQNC